MRAGTPPFRATAERSAARSISTGIPRGIRNDHARHPQRQRDRIRRNAGIGERVQNVRGHARLAAIAQKIFRKHPRHIGQPRIGVGAECGAHIMETIGFAVS